MAPVEVEISRAIREALGNVPLPEVPRDVLEAAHGIVWAWDHDLNEELLRRSNTGASGRVERVLARTDGSNHTS